MDAITLYEPRIAAPDTHVLPSYFAAPGLGLVPVNAFVINAAQPVLVDTGLPGAQEGFLRALESVIPIEDLRWLYLTHCDADHIGSLQRLLARAPRLRLVTTFLGMAKLSLFSPVPPERIYLLNPGQELDVGDRRLVCLRPPTYDAPETTALFDTKTRVLVSSDSFGAVVQAPADSAESLSATALRDGVLLWSSIDAPWLQIADESAYARKLDVVRSLAPTAILSSHLPPAHGINDTLLGLLETARGGAPFVGPDQAAFTRMLSVAA